MKLFEIIQATEITGIKAVGKCVYRCVPVVSDADILRLINGERFGLIFHKVTGSVFAPLETEAIYDTVKNTQLQ